MKISGIYLSLIITLLVSHNIWCQSPDSDFILRATNLPGTIFTEKLFVKTDKEVYISGEQLWFKIWCFDNFFNYPLSISKTGCIELLNAENNPIIRQKVSFDGSTLNNAFFIPDTLSSGNYKFRAYTQWMRNFDPEFFCDKTIQIINPFKNIQRLFHSDPDTLTHRIKQDPLQNSVTMHIRELEDSFNIKVTDSNLPSGLKDITILLFSGGTVRNSGTLTIKDSGNIKIPGTDMAAGLNEFIAFGKDGKISGKSLMIITPATKPSLKIVSNDTIFKTREKVIINLTLENNSKENINTDLAVTVTLKTPSGSLITPEDFNNEKLKVITSGKSWIETVLSDSEKYIFAPDIYGTRITGTVFTKNSKQPAGNVPLSLAFPGKYFQCWFTISEPDGKFVFTLNNYTGEKEILLSSASNSAPGLIFEVDNPYTNQITDIVKRPFIFDKEIAGYIEKASLNMQINRVKNIVRNKEPEAPDRTCFYGRPDKVFVLEKYIKIPTVSELISDLLPMVNTRKRGNKTQVIVLGMSKNGKYADILGYNPLLLIDGVPVFDSELFLQANVPDIERIEIIYSTYYFGRIKFDGVINLITLKGNCNIDLSLYSTRLTYQFQEPDKKFLYPDYSLPGQLNNRIPDFRTTLYWNPQVVFNKDGEAKIEFYTSDDTGEYVVDVEGYTSNGNRIKKTQNLIVKK